VGQGDDRQYRSDYCRPWPPVGARRHAAAGRPRRRWL